MKKNAFTLIELLAVILILGIIALIAIPTITKILDES
ncbi:MAG: prepilin-type N-terminal cleavage/methylation domain-containing protein, partial [Bacilli bacterium]